MATVEIDRLEKRYPTTTALKGVSLDRRATASSSCSSAPRAAASRRCCASIAGLEDVTAGTIRIDGRDVTDLEPRDRDIAMVFQSYALYPHMTVRDNMAFSLDLRKTPKAEIDARVTEAARILGLEPLLDAQAARPLRRPAPARRHGPRHRAPPAGLPLRRAALEPRRPAPRARCAPRSARCTTGSARPRSTSPTTRSRR